MLRSLQCYSSTHPVPEVACVEGSAGRLHPCVRSFQGVIVIERMPFPVTVPVGPRWCWAMPPNTVKIAERKVSLCRSASPRCHA